MHVDRLALHASSIALTLILLASPGVVPAADRASADAGSPPTLAPLPSQPHGVPWPTERWPRAEPAADVDRERLDSAVAALFGWVGRGELPDTRALLVVRHGEIVFERYAEGFGPESRFHTWSMAKSLTHALAGILVGRQVLALDEPAAVPEWRGADDPRRGITLRHLLNMTSGVDNGDFTGDGPGTGSFVAELLFGPGAADVNAVAADRPLIHPIGTHWAYSTASTTLVAGIIGRAVADDAEGRRDFIREALLDRIGAAKTVFEFDRSGHFLGGSHVYGNARDFARFGLLYLRDGIWEGRRILPEGWVDFARTRAPVENNGNHGAHFWLNLPPKPNQFVLFPDRPSSVFEASGNSGQYVILVPTHDLLVVRLGEMQSTTWDELNAALSNLIAVFPESAPESLAGPSREAPPETSTRTGG